MPRIVFMLALVFAAAGARVTVQDAGGVILAIPGRANAAPSIATAGRQVAVAWGAREPSGKADVFAALSTDGGRSFGPPVRVNDEPGTARIGGELPPRVVFSGSSVDVLWTSRGSGTSIRIARSQDAVRTFGASRELQASGAPGDRGWPAISADANGIVHAIWLDHRGLAEEGARTPHVHGAAAPVGAKRDGVAMAQRSALFYAGAAGEREIARGVCYCCKTALASGADGALFAAWRHVYPGNIRDIAFTSSRDGGRTFTSPVRVSEDAWQLDGCPDDGPSMAVDEKGTAHLTWPTVVAEPEPHKAIFYAATRDGRTFTKRRRVSAQGHNAAHPQIALDASGRAFVVWDEIDQGRRRLFGARATAAGPFSAPAPLSTAAAASYPALARSGATLLVASTEGATTESVIRVQPVRIEE